MLMHNLRSTCEVERHYRKWLLKNFGVREVNTRFCIRISISTHTLRLNLRMCRSKYFRLSDGPFAGSGATRLPRECSPALAIRAHSTLACSGATRWCLLGGARVAADRTRGRPRALCSGRVLLGSID